MQFGTDVHKLSMYRLQMSTRDIQLHLWIVFRGNTLYGMSL